MTDSIDALREQIDELDVEIQQVLLKRLDISKDVIALKKEAGLEALDEQREADILTKCPQKLRSVYKELLKISKEQN